MDCGTFDFDTGNQEFRCTQYGHYALVDAVAIGNASDFRPPGYTDFTESESIARCPSELRGDVGDGIVHLVSDREWTDHRINVSYPLARNAFVQSDSELGITFCSTQNGDHYALTITPDEGDKVKAALALVQHNDSTQLAEKSGLEWKGTYHSLMVDRVGDTIEAGLDGRALFTCDDQTLASGVVGVAARHIRQFDFQELLISSRAELVDDFGVATNWKSLSGTWRLSDLDSPDGGSGYIGQGENEAAISLTGWRLPLQYRFRTQLRILSGKASGLLFDWIDEKNYQLVTLCSKDTKSEDTLVLKVSACIDGNTRELVASTVDARVGRWFTLEIRKDTGKLGLWINDEIVGEYQCEAWNRGGTIGLFVDCDTIAEFGRVLVREGSGFESCDYLFEPDMDVRAISHWRMTSGKISLDEHPATITLRPEGTRGGDVALSWLRTISSQQRVRVSINTHAGQVEKDQDELDTLDPNLAFKDQSLALSARVGIELESLSEPNEIYAISIDKRSLDDLVITRNGDIIARRAVSTTPEGGSPELCVTLMPGSLSATIDGIEPAIVDIDPRVMDFRLTIVGHGFFPGGFLKLDGIVIESVLPQLSSHGTALSAVNQYGGH